MKIESLRFVEVPVPDGGAHKQYNVHANEHAFVRCDLSKRTIAKPVEIVNVLDSTRRTLSPERKILNRRWQLSGQEERENGNVAAAGTEGWLASDVLENELFRVLDPRKLTTKTLETVMGSWPDSYALVSKEACIGVVRRALRPGEEEPRTRLQKFKGLLKPRDWYLEFERPFTSQEAYLAIASVLLLIEVTVRGARAG